ncbi:MAG: hypothetical protein K0Q55_772 [Verrucomicrobia bacterium]|nr:hypothetical protein [Verrucomicrobiota bacterium]
MTIDLQFHRIIAHQPYPLPLAIKRGELQWAEVDAWRKELHKVLERALCEAQLPERLDYVAANEFLVRVGRSCAET